MWRFDPGRGSAGELEAYNLILEFNDSNKTAITGFLTENSPLRIVADKEAYIAFGDSSVDVSPVNGTLIMKFQPEIFFPKNATHISVIGFKKGGTINIASEISHRI